MVLGFGLLGSFVAGLCGVAPRSTMEPPQVPNEVVLLRTLAFGFERAGPTS
jgi:hypothetical protein